MGFAERWNGLSRATRNTLIVLAADIILLLSALVSFPGLRQLWNVLTGYLPDVYSPVFLQLIAVLRGTSPGAIVAAGTALTYTTIFLTLITMHVIVAYIIGFLFQKLKQTLTWSFVNYAALILALFILHMLLIAKSYWAYLP